MDNKLKKSITILVDAHVFDDYYQGTTTYIEGLYTHLVKDLRFEIIIMGSDIEKLKRHFSNKRFKFIYIKKTSRIKRIFYLLPKLIKKYNVDYVHFQYLRPPFIKSKTIVTVHDLLFLDFPEYFPSSYKYLRYFLFRYSAKKATLLFSVSEYSKKSISKHFNLKKKIIVTPNAVQLKEDYSETEGKPIKDKYLLYVSRIEPRKNHIMLLKAFINLKLYDDYSLVFIGKKEIIVKEYEDYISNLPKSIQKKIIHKENISNKELIKWYKNTELFIYPSIAEGFGIPPLEAITLGAKVICSNTTAMSDFYFFKGYQFDPINIDSLQNSILKALKDKKYPFDFIKNEVSSKYSWSKISSIFAEEIVKNDE